MQPVASVLKENYRLVWWGVFVLSVFPSIQLGYDYVNANLGINPLETLQQRTGHWTIVFLIITLSITPLRRVLAWLSITVHARFGKRLEDWNWIIRLRRMLGLLCFYYSVLHVGIYFGLDVVFDWQWFWQDAYEKPYIIFGILGFILLLPLAATSNDYMFNRMGLHRWRRLHYLVYIIAVSSIVHFWWQMKALENYHWPYTITLCVLLFYRLFVKFHVLFKIPRDNGMEVQARQ